METREGGREGEIGEGEGDERQRETREGVSGRFRGRRVRDIREEE